MRNTIYLLIPILTISSILLLNSGCNGSKSGDSFGSLAVPTAGKCGTTVNVCTAGTFVDTTDTTTEYLWTCNSPNGGTNASCTLAIPDNPDGSSDGLGDDTQFYVGVNSDINTIAHVRNISSFSTKCAIDKDSLANEDIQCLIDIPEGEAYANALTLRYNVPPDMCRYLRRETYWYYNQEVGIGPKEFVINLDIDDSGGTNVLTSYNCTVDGLATGPNCSGHPEVNFSIDMDTQDAKCIYDQYDSSVGQNCCFGKFIGTVNKNYTVQADTTSVVTGNWGGKFGACIGGPGRGWPHKSIKGVPKSVIDLARDGLNSDYALPAVNHIVVEPITYLIANYYDPVDHTHTGIVDPRSTNLPYFIDPVDDRNGTSIPTTTFDPDNFLVPGNDSYSFECLDEAFEIKHRIRVWVREWDTYPDFLTYISSVGVTSIPDRGLTDPDEGVDCTGITGACDDFHDVDDFLKLDLGLPGYTAPNATDRASYFPNLLYL